MSSTRLRRHLKRLPGMRITFDVSMDYIFGRTDNPQGKLYEYKPKIQQNDPQMQKFVEMCFDPASPMNARLKETLLQMLGEAKQ